jgi:hypothetical protein
MAIVASVAATLQELLGPVAEQLAEQHRLIRRQRQFTATTLLQTFVLGYLHKPTASVADLAATAEALGVRVTPQAIDQRFQPALRHTLHDLWHHAVTQVVAATPRAVELLQRFSHVLVGDSTTITLHEAFAEQYPGCGGSHGAGRSALKIQVQWDLLSGQLTQATLEPGRQPDSASPGVGVPPAGALALYDLGYFSLDRFATWDNAGVRWISKCVSKVNLTVDGRTQDLSEYLAGQSVDRIDRQVRVGGQTVSCRLIAIRVPEAVAHQRRRKAHAKAAKEGRRPSARHLALCAWTTYLTNCPAEQLADHEVEVLYRLRWQIELLFKLWKSNNHLADHRGTNPQRQMIEFFARLVAVVVQHWLVLTGGWSDPRLSLVKATRLIRERMPLLIEATGDHTRLTQVLRRLVEAVANRCRVECRRKRPSSPQILKNPALQKTKR